MMSSMLDREQAWNLLCEFTKSDGLRKHALAVETCVAAYARKLGEDVDKWSLTALLHDFGHLVNPDDSAATHRREGRGEAARGLHDPKLVETFIDLLEQRNALPVEVAGAAR